MECFICFRKKRILDEDVLYNICIFHYTNTPKYTTSLDCQFQLLAECGENEQADVGRDGRTCLARSCS